MNTQGTKEWLEEKLGKVGASHIKAVMAKGRNGSDSKTRTDYMMQLALERMTGEYRGSFCNKQMADGLEKEPSAREAYCFVEGVEVLQKGWVDHPALPMCGCSPDGVVPLEGCVEIKCPKITTHLNWMLADKVPTEHLKQMHWQMEVMGAVWNDFVSYCPELPIDLQLFIKRLDRDDEKIAEIREEVIRFLAEVDEMVEKLQKVQK